MGIIFLNERNCSLKRVSFYKKRTMEERNGNEKNFVFKTERKKLTIQNRSIQLEKTIVFFTKRTNFPKD